MSRVPVTRRKMMKMLMILSRERSNHTTIYAHGEEDVEERRGRRRSTVFNVWLSSHIWLFRLVSSQLISQLIDARYRQRVLAAAASRSFCLYASRSGANKKSPASVDWHYMTLRNHCQTAS
ncbi:hypothetical protein EYF80_022185 [Liparis tanakae]|uniref:Uncharacterized protein n=1 Tax=Liparis tanakae TaxID=230148 RepID=A0A4Z2HP41_9TELE|nr:hypothetical protein EYF80_022185 [Liparis tanakae]